MGAGSAPENLLNYRKKKKTYLALKIRKSNMSVTKNMKENGLRKLMLDCTVYAVKHFLVNRTGEGQKVHSIPICILKVEHK